MATTPKFPSICVNLTGIDGNAFSILGAVQREMRSHGVSAEDQAAFREEAMAGDYDHLLVTCMRWVEVD